MPEVRDPAHNFILFDDFEKRLINSRPVQRLKDIKQLALTCEVYPGATHTRFEHSLGTMELATQAFDTIVRKPSEALVKLGWADETLKGLYRQVLRVGALLHDIGHAPFSHGPEDLLPEGYDGHEQFSEELIRSDYIAPLLKKGPGALDVDYVVAVALGPEKSPQEDPSLSLLQELVGGELGVDRIDYRVRDALHTGATAGRFDYHRLLNTLTVIHHPDTGSPVLAMEVGGLHAAEALLLARYFMFHQVYFHDVRRVYDIHLRDFLRSFLPGGRFPPDLDGYLSYTDSTIHAAIAAAIHQGAENKEQALRMVDRRHYRTAWQVTPYDKGKDPEIFLKLGRHISDSFDDSVRLDEAGKEAQTLEEGRLYLVGDDGKPRDIWEQSELIKKLTPIWMGRVYAHQDVVKDVQQACRQFIGTGGGEIG